MGCNPLQALQQMTGGSMKNVWKTGQPKKKTDIVWFISTLNPHEHLFISPLYSILFSLIEQCSNPPYPPTGC